MKNYLMCKEIWVIILLGFILASCSPGDSSGYVIESQGSTIYVDENADSLVLWAANDLAEDLSYMLDAEISVEHIAGFDPQVKGIYIGEPDGQISKGISDSLREGLRDEWEKFIIKKYDGSLLIVGSDVRGTVYGIFEVAERLGISPWKWWADVRPEKAERLTLELPSGGIEESPSVQYRGIFLNDEDWGLQPWAAKTLEPETGDIGPKTYEKIFHLLLRLKANTIWPAMHPSTKPFFQIPGNKEMAEKYHIMVGTSHAEPMLRNNVGEWDHEERGDYNYFTNSEQVKAYWRERIIETRCENAIITLGMRGIHDSGMEGNATIQERVDLLETIISDQREMLVQNCDKPLTDIPQMLIPYKEVLDLYNNGMEVPEDITLIWTDDNYGYIRRLSNEEEQRRSGGSGVYYHISYWGRPHDYLWLSTTQPGLIWYEMTRAYQNGARKNWIVNVGDIKPAEYNMEFFLDLAWNINSISKSSIHDHINEWAKREFGEGIAASIAEIKQEYYRLAFIRKPEYMGWSQTEPTTQTRPSEFSVSSNTNELERRIDHYTKLVSKVEAVKSDISNEKQDAFFQLVEYPVKAAALMNCKFLFAKKSALASSAAEKKKYAQKVQESYDQIVALTARYNTEISEGKWDHMMSMKPRNLPVYQMPTFHLDSTAVTGVIGDTNEKKEKPIFIQADDYVKKHDANGYQWESIEGLGYSNASVTLFPLTHQVFTGELPYVEYAFEVDEPGDYKLEIRCLPTHSNNFDHTIWLEVDGEKSPAYKLNTRGRSEAWKRNVLRNTVQVVHPIAIDDPGKHTVKVFVNQTGIVLDQVAVTLKGYPAYYEIPYLSRDQ